MIVSAKNKTMLLGGVAFYSGTGRVRYTW